MSSIETGKQDTFSWWSKAPEDTVKTYSTSKPDYSIAPTIASQVSLHGEDLIPSLLAEAVAKSEVRQESPSLPLPEIPLNSHPLHDPSLSSLREFAQDVSPPIDRLSLNLSPKEPSRIHSTPLQSISSPVIHIGSKHPHPVDAKPLGLSTDPFLFEKDRLPEELPLKRQKMGIESIPFTPFNSSDEWDFNTPSGSDLIDFQFSKRIPSDVIELEETERQRRIAERANPLLVGKFFHIQKEFMNRLNTKPLIASSTVPEKALNIASSLSDLIAEKGHELIDSAKSFLPMDPIKKTLNEIAEESKLNLAPMSYDAEPMKFVWPRRVPDEIYQAEEIARSERRLDPIIFSRFKAINAQVRQKSLAKETSFVSTASSIVGKAAEVLDEAVHYTTDMIGKLGHDAKDALHLSSHKSYPSVQNDISYSGLESFRLQEELERARQINETWVDPVTASRKKDAENELLCKLKAP